MDFVTYLTMASPQFGTLAWLFFIGQIVAVGAGAYLYFVHTERNAARQTFMRQLAIALMIVGGVGIVLGVLRMLNVPVLNQRYWFYIQLVVELGIAGYVFYYTRSVLPELAKQASRNPVRPARPAVRAVSEPTVPPPPRPIPTTSRREARRERKRRK